MKMLFLFMLTLVASITAFATEPYFEVLSGSFVSGEVTVKVTFPEASTIEIASGNWDGLRLYHPSVWPNTVATTSNYSGTHSIDGNTITGTFRNFTAPEGHHKFYIEGDWTVDGVAYKEKVYAKDCQPYAEVVDGSLESGNVTVKVTVPYCDAAVVEDYSFVHHLFYDGVNVTNDWGASNISNTGNTYTITFAFTSHGDDVRRYSVVTDSYSCSLDGAWNSAPFVVYFNPPYVCPHDNITHHDAVDPTRTTMGNLAYDECDDCGALFLATDLGHENAVEWSAIELPVLPPPYFWVENRGTEAADLVPVYGLAIEWSKTPSDDESWAEIRTYYEPSVAPGEKIYLRATSAGNTNLGINFGLFSLNYYDGEFHYVPFAIGGDITRLLDADGEVATLSEPEFDGYGNKRGTFQSLFAHNENLVDASALLLPSTTLSESCYANMFEGCVNLSAGPASIDAETMAEGSCEYMFSECNLTAAPALPAETLAQNCYSRMFMDCANLVNAPALPATTLAIGCYSYMFADCASLVDAPALPATTLVESCYEQMFGGCASLTKAPELLAPTLVYGCYTNMFSGCSSLNEVKAAFESWNFEYYYGFQSTYGWLDGVAENGNIYLSEAALSESMYWSPSGNGIPYGWTSNSLFSVAVSSVGYATLYYDYNWVVPAGMEAYVAYLDSEDAFQLEKMYEAGDVVPAYAAFVLKAAPGTYIIEKTDEDVTDKGYYDNSIYGNNWDCSSDCYDYLSDDYYYYALSLNAENDPESVGFYWMTENGAPFYSAAYKAWLKLPKTAFTSGAKSAFVFGDDNEVDGINSAVVTKPATDAIYNLSGRCVEKAQKGLYIVNGKKVVIK